jgi:hypothetical protein
MTAEDDSLFLKYCPNPRDRCYHAMSRDSAARPHELLKLRIKDVVFKLTHVEKKQYAEILVNGKTGTRPIPLIDSIPYIKDWISNHHPQAGNPNSILLCGFGKSLNRAIRVRSIHKVYQGYKDKFFPKLNLSEHRREKQKLTLGIEKEVIERAKAADINISAITEELLKSVTYEPNDKSEEDVVKAYEDLFKAMQPLIEKYVLQIEVGGNEFYGADADIDEKAFLNFSSYIEEEPVTLICPFYMQEGQLTHETCYVKHRVRSLYEPKTILQNLILALVERAEKNKQKVRELKLAKRFVEVLLSDIEKV